MFFVANFYVLFCVIKKNNFNFDLLIFILFDLKQWFLNFLSATQIWVLWTSHDPNLDIEVKLQKKSKTRESLFINLYVTLKLRTKKKWKEIGLFWQIWVSLPRPDFWLSATHPIRINYLIDESLLTWAGCWPSGRAFASEPVDPEFDSGSGHTKDFRKLVFTASCLALSIKDSVKTKPASSLVVSLGKALNGIPPSCVVERW